MSALALVGIILILLALLGYVPLVLGLVLGIVLLVYGGNVYVGGRRRLP